MICKVRFFLGPLESNSLQLFVSFWCMINGLCFCCREEVVGSIEWTNWQYIPAMPLIYPGISWSLPPVTRTRKTLIFRWVSFNLLAVWIGCCPLARRGVRLFRFLGLWKNLSGFSFSVSEQTARAVCSVVMSFHPTVERQWYIAFRSWSSRLCLAL